MHVCDGLSLTPDTDSQCCRDVVEPRFQSCSSHVVKLFDVYGGVVRAPRRQAALGQLRVCCCGPVVAAVTVAAVCVCVCSTSTAAALVLLWVCCCGPVVAVTVAVVCVCV